MSGLSSSMVFSAGINQTLFTYMSQFKDFYRDTAGEIEADMAEQLARVREMERNGELEPIPEVSAAIQ